MAGLLGFLAAGAVKGAGDGIVAEARAKREAAIAALANANLVSRENADRSFRSEEGKLDRDARLGEAATDREFRSKEGALDRSAQAENNRLSRQETITGADGTTYVRDGTTAAPLKNDKGEPLKTAMKTADQPADVQTASWLIQQGIAATPEEAYKLVTQGKGDNITPAKIQEMAEKATKNEIGDGMGKSPEEVQAIRERNVKRLTETLMPKPAPKRPDGVSNEALIEQAKQAIAGGAPEDVVKARLKSFGIEFSATPPAPAAGSTTAKTGRTG
jgi:hypothetical protein